MSTLAEENRRLMRRLVISAIAMFGFGFALVPFYEKICEVTGINNLVKRDEVKNTQVDTSRSLIVEFDTNTRNLPWRFKALQSSVTIHPGALVRADFEVENTTDRPIAGQAIPSYGPALAAQHFKKLDCFCFTKQTLAPGEKRIMPVVFVIGPELPADVNTLTLSYTFFELPGTPTAAAEGGRG